MNKTYLGDGVYVAADEFSNVVLTTENGIAVTNEIILEPEIVGLFVAWCRKVLKLGDTHEG